MKLQEKREEASFSLRQIVSPLEKHIDRHSVFYMQAPFVILFILFIIIPVLIAIASKSRILWVWKTTSIF